MGSPFGWLGRLAWLACSVFVTATVAVTAAQAQPHGAREHDGFHLQLSLGVAAGQGWYREPRQAEPTTVRSAGAGLAAELTAGGRAHGPWLLHATVQWEALIHTRRHPAGTEDTPTSTTLQSLSLSPGVTRYWTRTNTFCTATVGLGMLTERRNGTPVLQSDPGVAASLALGWQRWVGDAGQWGVGPALRARYVDAPVTLGRIRERARVWSLSLLLTAAWS